jgi:hypothetical protein
MDVIVEEDGRDTGETEMTLGVSFLVVEKGNKVNLFVRVIHRSDNVESNGSRLGINASR